jgi:hypothetical protein
MYDLSREIVERVKLLKAASADDAKILAMAAVSVLKSGFFCDASQVMEVNKVQLFIRLLSDELPVDHDNPRIRTFVGMSLDEVDLDLPEDALRAVLEEAFRRGSDIAARAIDELPVLAPLEAVDRVMPLQHTQATDPIDTDSIDTAHEDAVLLSGIIEAVQESASVVLGDSEDLLEVVAYLPEFLEEEHPELRLLSPYKADDPGVFGPLLDAIGEAVPGTIKVGQMLLRREDLDVILEELVWNDPADVWMLRRPDEAGTSRLVRSIVASVRRLNPDHPIELLSLVLEG